MPALQIRPVTEADFAAFARVDSAAHSVHIPDDVIAGYRRIVNLDHTLAVFEDDAIVATAATMPFELTVPGGALVSVEGVAAVAVLPTHRRRGLLRELMTRQLADMRRRGAAAAVLTASESGIYGRFGYGLATRKAQLELDRAHAAFARPPRTDGRARLVDHAAADTAVRPLYDRVRRAQVGALSRSPERWESMWHIDPGPELSKLRFYVTYTAADGTVEGVCWYHVKREWPSGISSHTLHVEGLVAATPAAYAALWHYCLSVDLIATIRASDRMVDEPLQWLLADPRRLRVIARDDLWLRPLDIPALLAARRYRGQDRLVFAIADAFHPPLAGSYRLEATPDGAACHRTDDRPDLSLGVDDLGAIYLGGVNFATLARAGRIAEHTPGAFDRADALFAMSTAPWCATSF